MDMEELKAFGRSTGITCPECSGALWETDLQGATSSRCHVGHGFSAETLLELQGESTERALWAAVRALQESAALAQRMAKSASSPALHERYLERAREAEANATVMRRILKHAPGIAPASAAAPRSGAGAPHRPSSDDS
jgi:two-component system chemotaxis response regulator CheB